MRLFGIPKMMPLILKYKKPLLLMCMYTCFSNLAAVAAIMVLLMKLGMLLAESFGMAERGRALGLLAALFYGCSTGAMASVLLIRMYCVVTLFCVALLYLHVKKWKENSFDKKNGIPFTTR